ncbi:hypothetical protein SeLEV6574_g04571 [Synchytrium endobioticum]|nr:hypothetical protein SeLEV6574_g04571 [Synchytrium endobioticum]
MITADLPGVVKQLDPQDQPKSAIDQTKSRFEAIHHQHLLDDLRHQIDLLHAANDKVNVALRASVNREISARNELAKVVATQQIVESQHIQALNEIQHGAEEREATYRTTIASLKAEIASLKAQLKENSAQADQKPASVQSPNDNLHSQLESYNIPDSLAPKRPSTTSTSSWSSSTSLSNVSAGTAPDLPIRADSMANVEDHEVPAHPSCDKPSTTTAINPALKSLANDPRDPSTHSNFVSDSYTDSLSMDYQEEDYEAARMLKSLSSSYSGPSPVASHPQAHFHGHHHIQYPDHHTQYTSLQQTCNDEWTKRASSMVGDDRQFLESTTDDDDADMRNMSDWDSADESGDDCDGPACPKRRAAAAAGGGVYRYKPKNAAGVGERGDANGPIITATSSPESMSLATVGNARDGIPRWICPGCGKIYSIQSKRSWTNHMIACTGDMPPPIKKRKRRGA